MGWKNKDDAKRYSDSFKIDRKAYVYRYIDKADGITKYIGITHARELEVRLKQHEHDDWCKFRDWEIQYFECKNRSEAEAFESHLIALYGTGEYFNKAKVGWGINQYLPDIEDKWMDCKYKTASLCADEETEQMRLLFKELLRKHEIELAKEIFDLFEFEREE